MHYWTPRRVRDTCTNRKNWTVQKTNTTNKKMENSSNARYHSCAGTKEIRALYSLARWCRRHRYNAAENESIPNRTSSLAFSECAYIRIDKRHELLCALFSLIRLSIARLPPQSQCSVDRVDIRLCRWTSVRQPAFRWCFLLSVLAVRAIESIVVAHGVCVCNWFFCYFDDSFSVSV